MNHYDLRARWQDECQSIEQEAHYLSTTVNGDTDKNGLLHHGAPPADLVRGLAELMRVRRRLSRLATWIDEKAHAAEGIKQLVASN
jgi:hypothetical protein